MISPEARRVAPLSDVRGLLRIWGIILSSLFLFGFLSLNAREESGYPAELTHFREYAQNPVFTGAGPGHWDVQIRERGWIIRDQAGWKLWYTGFDGTKQGTKYLGLATSPDGLAWKRASDQPIYDMGWVEDVCIVAHEGQLFMFAEGVADQAQLLVSSDGLKWERRGQLEISKMNGEPIEPGPFGTPTAWFEDGKWYLLYERRDQAVWLAQSTDALSWKHVQDEPVLKPGPGEYDRELIAVNQVIRYKDRYWMIYHGTSGNQKPNVWSTNLAMSRDKIHWEKYPGNPLLPIEKNRSSGILVDDGKQIRLYTMHGRVDVYLPDVEEE